MEVQGGWRPPEARTLVALGERLVLAAGLDTGKAGATARLLVLTDMTGRTRGTGSLHRANGFLRRRVSKPADRQGEARGRYGFADCDQRPAICAERLRVDASVLRSLV